MATETVATGEIESAAARFEGQPVEALAWAAERFPERVTFATGFGAEGCVIIDLIARHRARRSTSSRSTPACCSPRPTRSGAGSRSATALTIRAVRPGADRRRSRRRRTASGCGSATPTAAARCARWSRCAGARGHATPGSPRSAATRRPTARRRASSSGTSASASSRSTRSSRWTHDGRLGATCASTTCPTNPLHDAGLPEHRLPAVHEPGRRGRRPARRPLARAPEDRVRPARPSPSSPVPLHLARPEGA